jgi:HSP20 family protein
MFALMPWRRERTPRALARRAENPFHLLNREFETLVNRFFEWPVLEAETWELPAWGFETEETEKEFVIRTELPGYEPAEVEVKLTGNVLAVVAEHKEPEAEGKEAEKRERRYARVERSLTLPPEVNTEAIEAVYRNGVLELHMPKTPEATGRRIEVKT